MRADARSRNSSSEEQQQRQQRDPKDMNDPHNWSMPALTAYLQSTAPAGKPGAKEQASAGSRQVLIRRCCELMGRPYFPPRESDDDLEAARGAARGHPAPSPPLNAASPPPSPQRAAVAEAAHANSSGWPNAEEAAAKAGGCGGMGSGGGMCGGGMGGGRMGARSIGDAASASSFKRRQMGDWRGDAPPSSYDESFQRRLFRRKRMQRLFPFLDESAESFKGGGATQTGGGGSPAQTDSSDSSSRRRPAARGSAASVLGGGGGGGADGWARETRGSRGREQARQRSQQQSQSSSSGGGGIGAAADGSPRRRSRPDASSADGAGPDAQATPTREEREEAARERRSRREATAGRAEERRKEGEQRRSRQQRASGKSSSAAAPASSASSSSAADVKADAAKRVEVWAKDKDFFAMLSTLDAFPDLNLSKGVGTSRGLERGAAPAATKKAFHRASLSLHPDRLICLGTPRRAEAEEIFKVLSSAFEEERKRAEVSA